MSASHVDVLLLEDIPSVGRTGDIVSVSAGYARNFLFPQGKAALATATVRLSKKRQVAQQKAAGQAELKAWQEKAEQLDGTELTLTARLKGDDQIFGRITATQIARALNKQLQLELKANDIDLKKPLTTTGSQLVEVTLSSDVIFTIHVTVVPEGDNTKKAHEKDKD